MQMDIATVEHISRCTDLPAHTVADALRSLERIGVITSGAEGYQVTLKWWLEVYRLLARRNLIVREKP